MLCKHITPVNHTDPTGYAIGLIIGIIVGAVGLVLGVDAIIQAVGDYKRNPTAANIFAIMLAVALFVVDLFFFVSEIIAAVRALKAVDAVVDTAKVVDGAGDVVDATASLSKVDDVTTARIHGNSLDTTKPAQGYALVDRNTGDILKYGETTRGKYRYTHKQLDSWNADMNFIRKGTKREMHRWQHDMIVDYYTLNNKLPPLNKSFY